MFDPVSYYLARRKADKAHTHVRTDITDLLPITRTDLEYPTENVSFAYLAMLGKTVMGSGAENDQAVIYTSDVFTDKAVKIGVCAYVAQVAHLRWTGTPWARGGDVYISFHLTNQTTADHQIWKWVDGASVTLAVESVDLSKNLAYMYLVSIAGSVIKSYRDDFATPKLTATDTSIVSGRFGVSTGQGDLTGKAETLGAVLLSPSSPSTPAKAIIEIDYENVDEPRPNLRQELAEINKLTNIPGFLKREAKKYEALKSKGFTDEEIEALLGYIPQHQVDIAAVTWGIFDHKPKHSTMLVTITSDNPYVDGAIEKQVEHARSKNLRVLKPPRDHREAAEQYRQLRQDFPEWIAGKDNYAYQSIGHEVFEAFQAADFLHGFLVEHRTRPQYDQLKQVPDWEMRRTISMWKKRLERVSALTEERDKHLRKLREVEKLGW